MKFYEKKKYNRTMMLVLLLGVSSGVILAVSSSTLSDFVRGFIQGLCATGTLVGMIHVIICFVKKRNPFTGEVKKQ